MRDSVSPHARQYLSLSIFMNAAVLVSKTWYHIVALVFIFLMTNVERFYHVCIAHLYILFNEIPILIVFLI